MNSLLKNEPKKEVRLRTVNQCVKKLKELDPDTAVTTCFIRKLVKTAKVRCIPNGSRVYVDFDDLLKYLNEEEIL